MSSQSVVHRRLPNFEILRVLAMFLIIVGHFFVHGLRGEGNGVMLSYDGKSVLDTVSFGIAQSLWVFSSISVNLYVLISGYFLVQSKAKWGKIPSIWTQTAFYSVCIYLLFAVVGLGGGFLVLRILYQVSWLLDMVQLPTEPIGLSHNISACWLSLRSLTDLLLV